MGMSLGVWPLCLGLWGLLSALPVRGRGDTFQVEHTQANDLAEASNPPDDILNINQVLILPEAPESSFLLEGDIIKASPFRLFSSANPRWPKKRGIVQIPYVISYKYDNSSMKTIKEAFEDFAKFTCIKFVPYSYQRDFISIAPLSGCFSSVGRIGGMQVVSLAPACLRKGKGVALHELMHVLGFWHEHSRADRDKYISISWNEILTGFEINFMKSWNSNMLVDYDYSSVMHYGRNAFSMTGLPTIIPLSSSYPVLGQRWYLSNSDIARVNKLYKCSQMAAQPEMSAERAVKENVMDFVPSETEPCSTASKVKSLTAWNPSSSTASASEMAAPARQTLGPPMSSSRAVANGLSAMEAQTRVWPSATETQDHSMASPETPGKAEGRRKFITAAAETARKTQSREMENKKLGTAAHKSSVPQTSQAAYMPSGQISTEPGTRAAPELELRSSFLTKGPVPFSTEMVQEVTMRPGKKEAGVALSQTQAAHLEYRTDLSTAMEVETSQAMRSSKSEGENASLGLTEGYRFPVTENQPKELFRQTVSISGNEADSPAYTQPVESVQTEVTSFSYRTPSPRAPGNLLATSSIMGLGGGTIVSEAPSLENFPTVVSQSRLVENEEESSYSKNGEVPPYPGSTTMTSQEHAANQVEHSVLPSLEAPALASVKDQEKHHNWVTAGAPSSPWAGIMGFPAASRRTEVTPSESSSAEHPTEVELFSQSLAHLGRKGYRWGTFATHVPPGSASMHVAEPEVEVAEHPSDHAELPRQTSPGGGLGSLPIETNHAAHPTGRSSPPRAESSHTTGLKPKPSWPEPSNTEGFGPGVFTVGWAPSADVEGEALEHPTAVSSIATGERPSIGRKGSVSHGGESGTGLPKETKMHGRTSMWRLFPTELFQSQRPFQPGHVVAETQRQPSSTLSVGRGITGAGNSVLRAKSLNRLRTTVAPRQCGELLAGSLSGTKASHVKHTTEGRASLDVPLKLGATEAASPGTEAKERGSTLEGGSLLVRETRMPLSWASGSSNPRERERMDNRAGLLKGQTASAVRSELRQTMPRKRTPERIEAIDRGAAETTHVASSSSSTISVLRKSTPEGPQSSLPLGGTDSVMNTDSLAAPSLELAPQRKFSSKLKEMVSSAEGGPPELEHATEETFLHRTNGATTPAQEDTARESSAQSLLLDGPPTAWPHVTTGGTALLLTTGSLESPKPVNYREGSTGRPSTKETLPLTEKVPSVGTATTLSAHQSSALSRDSWESQSMVSTGTKEASSATSQENGGTALQADFGPLASAEVRRIPSAGASSLGSHEEHTAVAAVLPVEPLEGTTWPASEAKATTVLWEEHVKSLSTKSATHAFEEPTAATVTGTGFKRSGQKGAGMADATSVGAELSSSQLPDSNSTIVHGEELTPAHGEEGSVHSSAGLTSKLHSGASALPHSGDGTTEVAPSVPGAQKVDTTVPLEMSSEGTYPMVTETSEEAAVTTRTPGVHPQTLGSVESGIWSKNYMPHAVRGPKETYGHGGFPLSKGFPVGIENGELLAPSPEPPGQTSETQIVTKVKGISRNHVQKRKPGQIRGLSVDNHDHLHVGKRSLLEIRATPASFVMSQPEWRYLEGELPGSSTKHLNPSPQKTMKAFPKEHVLRTWVAALIGTMRHLPDPGCSKVHCGNLAVGCKNGAFPAENTAKAKELGKAVGMSTFKSRSLALLQRLPSAVEKAGSHHVVHKRPLKAAQSLAFCDFEMNLCACEQSKTDDLDWMLEKEQEQPAAPVEDVPCRTSGGAGRSGWSQREATG